MSAIAPAAPPARAADSSGGGRRMPAELGIWIFILADLVIFAIFFGTIAYLRAKEPALFQAGSASLDLGIGLANTLILLTSSLVVFLGVIAARRGHRPRARALLAMGVGLGLTFAVVKFFEYSSKVDAGFTIHTNDFFLSFFAFTGIHLVHVLIGTAILAGLAWRVGRPAGVDARLLEGGACYWHLVDLLWLVLFALLYLAP